MVYTFGTDAMMQALSSHGRQRACISICPVCRRAIRRPQGRLPLRRVRLRPPLRERQTRYPPVDPCPRRAPADPGLGGVLSLDLFALILTSEWLARWGALVRPRGRWTRARPFGRGAFIYRPQGDAPLGLVSGWLAWWGALVRPRGRWTRVRPFSRGAICVWHQGGSVGSGICLPAERGQAASSSRR